MVNKFYFLTVSSINRIAWGRLRKGYRHHQFVHFQHQIVSIERVSALALAVHLVSCVGNWKPPRATLALHNKFRLGLEAKVTNFNLRYVRSRYVLG